MLSTSVFAESETAVCELPSKIAIAVGEFGTEPVDQFAAVFQSLEAGELNQTVPWLGAFATSIGPRS